MLFEGKRSAYVMPPQAAGRVRLIAGLHGVCNPPEYACGYWIAAASQRGLLVCPEGNTHCGAADGNATTWTKPAAGMSADLEKAIAAVADVFVDRFDRKGAVLMGFSKGAYAAPKIAAAHPGRWPYLILVEAKVRTTAAALRAAKVRAVALIAGERSGQHATMRRTAAQLAKQGFAAKLWVMPKAGHHYSANIDAIMAEALDFVVAAGAPRSEEYD